MQSFDRTFLKSYSFIIPGRFGSPVFLALVVFASGVLAGPYVYFATDVLPAEHERSPESTSCYRFTVESLEAQLGKLKLKYGTALQDGKISEASDGSRVLTAYRIGDDGDRIDYFYSEQPHVCDDHQQARFQSKDREVTSLPTSSSPKPVEPKSAAPHPAKPTPPLRNAPAALELTPKTPSDTFQEGVAAYEAGDYAKALALWRPLAERGNASAQHNLGIMYSYGRSVAEDHAEAVRWYRKAAQQGYVSAQYNLGVMYANGRGVAMDHAEAVRWWRDAAEHGDAVAQYNLGVMYINGQGVAQDHAEAAKWFGKAAEQGDPQIVRAIQSILNKP